MLYMIDLDVPISTTLVLIWIAWSILFTLGVFCCISLANALGLWYQPFMQRAKVKTNNIKGRVSILIPARNEEASLPHLLSDLQSITQKIREANKATGEHEPTHSIAEILIYNDESTDNTASCIERFAQSNPLITQIQGQGLPKGWRGKNHACHILGSRAQGDYLLFLDADVRLSCTAFTFLLWFAQSKALQLVSVFPGQILNRWFEYLTVPLFDRFLLSFLWLPLVTVQRWPMFAAANGQCMLFTRQAYQSTQPHKAVAATIVEDIAIAKLFKTHNLSTYVLLGRQYITCHMYSDAQSAVSGVLRSIGGVFNHKLIFPAMLGLFWLSAVPVLFMIHYGYGLAGIALQIVQSLAVSHANHQSKGKNLLWLIPQNLLLVLLPFLKKGPLQWKNRALTTLALLLTLTLQAHSNPCEIASLFKTGTTQSWQHYMQTQYPKLPSTQKGELQMQSDVLYIYIGFLLGNHNKPQAQKYVDTLITLMHQYKQTVGEDAFYHARQAGITGFKIALAPWKAPLIGPENSEHIQKALALDSQSTEALIEQANTLFYAPALFGGNRSQALHTYTQAYYYLKTRVHNHKHATAHNPTTLCQKHYGRNGDYSDNLDYSNYWDYWRYWYIQVQLAVVQQTLGNSVQAKKLLKQTLQQDPEFKWAQQEWQKMNIENE
jgi:glycosyltransferase involved in cell wall biosynthesis